MKSCARIYAAKVLDGTGAAHTLVYRDGTSSAIPRLTMGNFACHSVCGVTKNKDLSLVLETQLI